jgi:hypothetical protein
LFGPKAIFLSPAIDSPSFIATVSLLGNPALGTKPRPIQLEKPCGLVFYDTIAMLGKGFHKLVDRDVAVYRYIEPLPGSVLCALDNRKPFATHMLDSLGHSWALFASPLGRTPSNNLCETGLYVPLLDRIARYSLESIHKESDEWIAGRPRRNPFLGSRHPAIVYNVRNERSTQWSNQLQVKFDEPGIYRVQPHDGPSFWIAVNADSEETAMTYRSPKALQRVKGIGAGEFLAHLKAGKGFVFSYGLWIALAALFFVEMLFWERDNGMRNEQIERKV